ncbi:MAG TPA: peptidase U62, partial [Edaphobacter sp.]|nr:peptidase U62 [Edaphobacter sp.]
MSASPRLNFLFVGTLVLASVLVPNLCLAQAQSQIDDPMLKAMKAELEREKQELVLPGMQRPYFIEYRLDDFSSFEAVANYGALTRQEEGRQRVVRVTVRVGDYNLDSSTGKGDGVVQLAPGEDDPAALRYALWTATDEAYKNALRAYSAKMAALQQFQSSRVENDFSREKPVVHIEPLRKLEIDRKDWVRRVVDASGLYASAPEVRDFADKIQYSTANIRAMTL